MGWKIIKELSGNDSLQENRFYSIRINILPIGNGFNNLNSLNKFKENLQNKLNSKDLTIIDYQNIEKYTLTVIVTPRNQNKPNSFIVVLLIIAVIMAIIVTGIIVLKPHISEVSKTFSIGFISIIAIAIVLGLPYLLKKKG